MNHGSVHRAWAEVDTESIVYNLNIIRREAQGGYIMPVVKANAYGHGLELVVRRLDREDVAFFGVANVGEARRVIDAGVGTRPFILGPSLPEEREEIVQRSWGGIISSVEEIAHFESLCAAHPDSKCSLHLALDTGMGREGFLPQDLAEVVQRLQASPHLRLEGLMSHYAAADEDAAFTQEQYRLFSNAHKEVARCFPLLYRHITASAGLITNSLVPENLARPGLLLYGISPIPENPLSAELRPALRLLSRVVLVRSLPAGHTVSYGHTYTTRKPVTRVATVGIGYADGWPRRIATQRAFVYIAGKPCRILGRITMDMIMVDVTQVPNVCVGDEVELIGPHQPVTKVAKWAGTIPWEILTGLGVRLPRIEKSVG